MPKTTRTKQPSSKPVSAPKSTNPTNPNYPSTSGKPSGGGRGNRPKPKGK